MSPKIYLERCFQSLNVKYVYKSNENQQNYIKSLQIYYRCEIRQIYLRKTYKMQQTKAQKVYTNSCIELSIPFEYQQYGAISCNWSTMPMKHNQSYISQFLTYQPRTTKDKQRTYYVCSPLDIGSYVNVKIQQEMPMENFVLDQLRYGPVELQENLFNLAHPGHWTNVQILLNKNTKKQANISVSLEGPYSRKQKAPPNPNIIISIKISGLQFNLPINQQIAKAQLESFQKSPFFKIYDSEPNALGIFISYRMVEFTQKLKQLFVFNYLGNYLKLYFENRSCRDIFVFSVLCQIDYCTQKLWDFKQQLYYLENQAPKIKINYASPHNLAQLKNQSKELLKIPKIQSIIRASQIMGNQFIGVNSDVESQSGPKPQQNILEDIYNILYTPIIKIERESFHLNEQQNFISKAAETNEKSIEVSDDQYAQKSDVRLNSSVKGNSQVKNRGLESYSTDRNYNENEGNNQRIRYTYKKQKTLENDSMYEIQSAKLPPKQKLVYLNSIKNGSHQPNFQSELRQIDLLQRIDELTKINQQLMTENKRLKRQNQRLLQDETKHEKIRQLNKMIQIKQMVQLMAQKLEHLQGNPEKGNNNQSPISAITNNYVPKTKKQLKEEYARVNAQQKQEKNQGVPLQNSKKIWSPRAHQQMMKNIKQKNVEQKSSVHKPGIGQLLRKKSASQFNLFEDGSSKPKKQVISMKQCLSFGKSNGFAPLNIQQSDQKQKIQKPEMHLPSQAPENPKKQLFQFPADPQKPSYYKNLGSSPSQPVFRNVFGS